MYLDPSEKVVYIAERQNHRIQVFDHQGAFVTKWDVSDKVGNLQKPRDVVMDSSGRIYVLIQSKNEIDVFGIPSDIQKNEK